MEKGKIDEVLYFFSFSVGDCVFILVGMVYVLGSGLLIVEI